MYMFFFSFSNKRRKTLAQFIHRDVYYIAFIESLACEALPDDLPLWYRSFFCISYRLYVLAYTS